MDFSTWKAAVDRALVAQGVVFTTADLDEEAMQRAHSGETTPDDFAKQALPALTRRGRRAAKWGPAFGMAIVFELVGVVCWVGAGVAFMMVYGTLKQFGPAVTAAALWFLSGALLFFMGSVIRLLIGIERNTSR